MVCRNRELFGIHLFITAFTLYPVGCQYHPLLTRFLPARTIWLKLTDFLVDVDHYSIVLFLLTFLQPQVSKPKLKRHERETIKFPSQPDSNHNEKKVLPTLSYLTRRSGFIRIKLGCSTRCRTLIHTFMVCCCQCRLFCWKLDEDVFKK